MFCNYCGAPNLDDSSFCSKCGKRIAAPAAAGAQQPTPNPVADPAPQSAASPQAPATAAAAAAAPAAPPAAAEPPQFLSGHTFPINELAYSPDGRHLATASLDRTARLWDVAARSELRTFTADLYFQSVDFSPYGLLAMAASVSGEKPANNAPTNSITLWDPANPGQLRALAGHSGEAYCVRFSPDGRKLAATEGGTLVNLWDVATGQLTRSFKQGMIRSKLLGGQFHTSLAFSPNGRWLALRSNPILLWDFNTGHEGITFQSDGISLDATTFLQFTPDSQAIVECKSNGTIRIWDAIAGDVDHVLADPPKRKDETNVLVRAALSRDAKFLAVSSYASAVEHKHSILLWDISAKRPVGALITRDRCEALAFSPDGEWLAVSDILYGVSDKPVAFVNFHRVADLIRRS